MTRGRRGADGSQDGGFWQPGEYDDDDYPGREGYRQSAGTSGPPWETGSWQADPGWATTGQDPDRQARSSGPVPPGPARDPHPSGPLPPGRGRDPHPSGPLPTGRMNDPHPSGPLPPLPAPGQGWQDDPRDNWGGDPLAGGSYPADGGYPQDGYGGGYGQGGHPGDDYQTGGFQTGSFETGGFQTGGFQTGGYGSYQGGPDTGGYPAADYAGSGFGDPLQQHGYGEDYPAGAGGPEYGDNAGQFADDPRAAGYTGRDPGNYPGDPDRGGWYSDVDDQQVWTDEDDADSGFLPGLTGDRGGGRRRDDGRPGGRAVKRRRSGTRRVMLVLLSVLLLIVLAAGGYGYHLYRTYIAPPDFSGPGTGSVVVQIKNGETAADIGQVLQQKGVVASARAFSNAAKASPQGNTLEPGYFKLHQHMQASLALSLLLKPSSRLMFKVTIPEGLRESQIIATLGKATGNLAGYQAAARNPAALGLPPFAKGSLEGYLFPATYTIQPGTPPVQVLKAMVQRFDQAATAVNLPAVVRHDQLSNSLTQGEHDAIVVASLVQAEGGRVQDFAKIARVIYNRLNTGMQLQLDSTVMYALNSYGIMASDSQLNVKSLYNTYRHAGLPPTPIDSPGQAAIEAALHPAAGPWLYFVTVDPKTGVTEFTSDPNVFAQLRAQLQQNVANGK